ncbi:MAG: hypothetical protein Q7S76_00470 [bacterium]|nr:hypothetical protein [bacterium]
MKKITSAVAILLFMLPSISFAAALTSQQSTSLIAVVQSSPGTPASAFVSLITAFSNITVTQAASLITVVQAAPGVPANAFVNLLTSFTVDTVAVVQSTTPATISSDMCTNIEGVQTTVPGGMTATGNVCIATQVNTPVPTTTSTQNPTPVPVPTSEPVATSQPISAPVFVSGPTPVVVMINGGYTIEKINWQTKEPATMVWWPTVTKSTSNLKWLCDGLGESGNLKARTTYNCMFRVANSAGMTTDAPFTLTTGAGALIVQELENRSGGSTRSFMLNDTVPVTIKKISFDVALVSGNGVMKFDSLSLQCDGSRWNLCPQQHFTVSGPFSFTQSPENITTYSQKIEIPVNITLNGNGAKTTDNGDRVTFTTPSFSGLVSDIRWYTLELDRADINIIGSTFVQD